MEIKPWENNVIKYFHERWFIKCNLKLCEKRIVKRHVKSGICNDKKSALKRWNDNDKPNGLFLMDNLNKDKLNVIIESTQNGIKVSKFSRTTVQHNSLL